MKKEVRSKREEVRGNSVVALDIYLI